MTVDKPFLSALPRVLAACALGLCLCLAACDAAEDDALGRSPAGGTASVSFDGDVIEMNAYYTIERALDDPEGEGGRFALLFVDGSAESYIGFERAIVLRHEDLSAPEERLWWVRDFDDTTEYFYGDVYLSADEAYRAELGAVRITDIREDEIEGNVNLVYEPSPNVTVRITALFTAVPYPPEGD